MIYILNYISEQVSWIKDMKLEKKFIFGTLWSIVFRNKKLRINCIKYINEVVPPYNEIIQDENNREKSDANLNIENNEDFVEEIEINVEENEDKKENENNIDNDKEKIIMKNKKGRKIKYTRNQVIEKFYPNLSVLILNSLQELILILIFILSV